MPTFLRPALSGIWAAASGFAACWIYLGAYLPIDPKFGRERTVISVTVTNRMSLPDGSSQESTQTQTQDSEFYPDRDKAFPYTLVTE